MRLSICRNKKRGSLSLSVNAIVVLIMAIAILGLGLGFVKSMFGKMESQFAGQVEAEPDAQTPSNSNPITISRQAVVGEPSGTAIIKLAVYCGNPSGCTTAPAVAVTCGGSLGTTSTENPSYDAMGYQDIQQGIAQLELPSASKTYICKATATGLYSASSSNKVDFTIRVK